MTSTIGSSHFAVPAARRARLRSNLAIGLFCLTFVVSTAPTFVDPDGTRRETAKLGFPTPGDDGVDVGEVAMERVPRARRSLWRSPDGRTITAWGLASCGRATRCQPRRGPVTTWIRVVIADDGEQAGEVCGRLRPAVVVMGVRMPLVNGIEATRRVRSAHEGGCRVLVVTTFDLDDYVLGAVRAGASGFLLNGRAPEQLAGAVRTVAAGEAIVAPRATARLLAELTSSSAAPAGDPGPLTDREVHVVRLMAMGLSNDDIAAAACISRATVKTHVSSILAKLKLTRRIQIVVWPSSTDGRAAEHRGADHDMFSAS